MANESEVVEVTFSEDGSAAQIAAQLVNALDAAFSRATTKLGDRLEKPFKDMADAGKKASKSTSKIFDEMDASLRRATRSAESFASTMGGIRNTTAKTGSLLDPDVFDASRRSFNTLDESIERIIRNFDRLSTTSGGRQVLGNLTAAIRSQANQANVVQQSITRVAEQEAKARADAARVAQQRETALAVRASKERIVAAQQEGAQTLAAMRASASQRVAIIQSVSRQLAALQNNIGRIGVASARAFTTGLSGVGNIFSNLTQRVRSSTREINRELVSTNSVLDRRTSVFRSAFSRQSSLVSSSVNSQITQIERLDRALSTGAIGAATGRSATAGALGFGGILAGGAGLSTLLTSGFSRFSELERLNKQFLALTGNAAETALLMGQIKEFAKTTSFDLVGVADLAKGFLAMGTATEDVLPRVRTIADAVALTGGGVDELNRIQRAIGQVVSAGRLQGDELNQLAENLPGLNIRQILAKQLGKSVPELVEMQEAGEITADMFLTGLLTGLSEDTRLSGAAQDLAETVKGRFDNLKESFADLGASLIGVISGQLRFAFKVLNDAFAGVAQFIRGEGLSEGLEVLRTGLAGAATALAAFAGGLVALQGLRIIGVILAGIATPMGLLVAGVVAAGAAFRIFSERSESFRRVVGEVRDGIVGMVDAFRSNVLEVTATGFAGVLETIGVKARVAFNYIGDVVLPRIAELATAFGDFVVGRARAFASFFADEVVPRLIDFANAVRTEVVPRLQAFVGFITGEVVPAVRNGLVNAFNGLRDGIVSFWRAAQPILAPAAEAIGRVTSALKELIDANPQAFFNTLGAGLAGALGGFAVAGPAGAVIGGVGAAVGALFLQGFGDEIVDGLQTVGSFIVDGLQSGLRAAQGALGRIFTIDNIIDVGFLATELAQRLGRVIGNALSDPRLVAGVAGFAGFATLAAARFVIGFGQGVISNVPELAQLLATALKAALSAAVDSVVGLDASALATALTAVFIGGTALRMFRSAGVKAGTQVQMGMLESFRTRAFGGAFAGGGTAPGGAGSSFFRSLFGGPDAISRSLEVQMANANSVALRETKKLNATLALAGRGVAPAAGGIGDAVRKQYAQLVSEVGPSGILGLRLRAGVQAGINSLRSLSVAPFRDFLNSMGVTGFQLARQAGTKVAAGLAGGIAGFQIGKSLASAGLGEQILGIGGTALAIGAINPVAGVAAGALGVLGVAMGKVANEAKRTKANIQQYADALTGIGEADVGKAGLSVFLEQLKGASDGVVDLLADMDFNARRFVEGIASGSTTPLKTFTDLLSQLGDVGADVATLMADRGVKSVEDFKLALSTGAGFDVRRRLDDIGISAEDLIGAFEVLSDRSGELRAGLDRAADTNVISGFDAFRNSVEGALPAIDSLIGGLRLIGLMEGLSAAQDIQETEQAALDATAALDNARTAADQFLNGSYGSSLQGSIDDLIINLPNIESQLAGLADLPAAVADATRRQLGDSIQLDLKAAIKVGLETSEITDPTQFLNELKFRIQSDINAGTIPVTAGAEVIAQIDSLLASPTFATDMATLLQSIVDNGTPPVVPAPFTLDPQVTISEDAKSRIGEQITTVLGGIGSGGQFGMSRGVGGRSQGTLGVDLELDPQISLAPGAAVAAAAAGLELARAVAGGFTSGGGTVATAATTAAALAALSILSTAGQFRGTGVVLAGQFAQGISSGRAAAVSAAVQLGAAASAAVRSNATAAFNAGFQIAQGLAQGIRSGAAAAIAAARAMASAVAAATRSALGIFSPSKVFATIGMDIGRGLAQGIADSEGVIAGAANNAVDALIKTTTDRADEIAAASASLFGLLQPGGSNGITAGTLTRQRAGLATLATDLQQVFQNSAQTLWDAVVATGEGRGDALQQNINHQFAFLGQNFGVGSQASLDPNFVLGSMNVAGFLDAGEKVREFIETAVQSGADLGSVINEARGFRDQLVSVATSFGANADAVNGLLNQLGISESAFATFISQVEQLRNEANQIRQPTPNLDAQRQEEERAREEADRAREEAERAAHEAEVAALKEELRRQSIDSRPIDIHVAVPYGDPEAIGLGVVNRLAFELGR